MTAAIRKLAWLHIVDRRLLCVRTRGRDSFYVPGGKPEPGESDQAALKREIAEELGVTLIDATIAPRGAFTAPADGAPGATVAIAAFAGEAGGEPRAQGEIEALRWIGAAEPVPVSAATRLILDRLKAENVID